MVQSFWNTDWESFLHTPQVRNQKGRIQTTWEEVRFPNANQTSVFKCSVELFCHLSIYVN